jgi:hypothetical protein
VHECDRSGKVPGQHTTEQLLLIAEGAIQAAGLNAHNDCEVMSGRAFISLLPEHAHCSIESFTFIETPRPPRGTYLCHLLILSIVERSFKNAQPLQAGRI